MYSLACVQVSSHEGTDTEARTNQPPCSRCVQALLLRIKHFSEKEAYSTPCYSFFPSLHVPKFYRFLSSHKTVNSARVSTTRITNHLYSMGRRRTKLKWTASVIYWGEKCFYFLCLFRRRNFFSTWKPRLCGLVLAQDAIIRPWIIDFFEETIKKNNHSMPDVSWNSEVTNIK